MFSVMMDIIVKALKMDAIGKGAAILYFPRIREVKYYHQLGYKVDEIAVFFKTSKFIIIRIIYGRNERNATKH